MGSCVCNEGCEHPVPQEQRKLSEMVIDPAFDRNCIRSCGGAGPASKWQPPGCIRMRHGPWPGASGGLQRAAGHGGLGLERLNRVDPGSGNPGAGLGCVVPIAHARQCPRPRRAIQRRGRGATSAWHCAREATAGSSAPLASCNSTD